MYLKLRPSARGHTENDTNEIRDCLNPNGKTDRSTGPHIRNARQRLEAVVHEKK